MFDNNFGNVDRFSNFFYQLILEKILYVYTTKISTSPHLQYVATLPCEIQNPKTVREGGMYYGEYVQGKSPDPETFADQ